MLKTTLLTALLAILPAVALAQDDDAARAAYLARRAAEKKAAEEAVEKLGGGDLGVLTADENIRLCRAYNELGNNDLALAAVCRVPDAVLAERKQLELKAICFHNVNSSGDNKDQNRLRELAFIDRCLDRGWGNQGVWLWRKAKVICQASVAPAIPTRGDVIGEAERILDREQYDYSFELLQQAFKVEPKLRELSDVSHEFMWPGAFPILHKEPRFLKLVKMSPVDAPPATPQP
jgi:hypothetical protein